MTEEKLESPKEAEELHDWNLRLLPLMSRMLIGLTVFFFLATAAQLAYLHVEISSAPAGDFQDAMEMLDSAGSAAELSLPAATVATQVSLERNAMERRYHQANVSLMSRVWTRYLGFATGMILAMVGAVFILGRLQTRTSEVGAKAQGTEFNIKSESPGLILATLGVALMIITIITHHEISVDDRAIYAAGWSFTAPASAPKKSAPQEMNKPQQFPGGSSEESAGEQNVPVNPALLNLVNKQEEEDEN